MGDYLREVGNPTPIPHRRRRRRRRPPDAPAPALYPVSLPSPDMLSGAQIRVAELGTRSVKHQDFILSFSPACLG